MATYKKPSRNIPIGQRIAYISDIGDGDTIDIEDILGAPARMVKIITPDVGDVIELRINNRYRVRDVYHAPGYPEDGSPVPTSTTIISKGEQHPIQTLTGDTLYYTEELITVSFIEVVNMTPATGTTVFEIMAW